MRIPLVFGALLAISAFNITATSTAFAGDSVDVDVIVCWEGNDADIICDELADLAAECSLVDPEGTVEPCNGEGWTYKRPEGKPQITTQSPQQPRSKPERKRLFDFPHTTEKRTVSPIKQPGLLESGPNFSTGWGPAPTGQLSAPARTAAQ